MFSDDNVLKVVAVADKYRNEPLISKCKNTMVVWIKDCNLEARGCSNFKDHVSIVLRCLNITAKANELGYSDVLDVAVDAISRYSCKLYTKSYWKVNVSYKKNKSQQQTGRLFGSTASTGLFTQFGVASGQNDHLPGPVDEIQKECVEVFGRLPESLQHTIRKDRLARIENNEFIF